MQAACAHVPFGGDVERPHDRQEAAGPACVERWRLERFDAAPGVGIDGFRARAVEKMRQVG